MIDVVIVAKNEQRHLGAVLSALKEQEASAPNIKVMVVDNGSTDDTVAIAKAHGSTVIQTAGSLGRARNTGIAYGSGDLVAFLDAHSVPSSNWATSMSAVFEKKRDLGAVMGSIENISERPGTRLFAHNSIFSSPERLWRNTISGLNSPLPWIPTGNCMYSRTALEDVDGFNESLFRCEDTDLTWKVVLAGYQLLYVPEARVTHYDQAGATSYLRKYYNYGAGAAELAQLYEFQARTERTKGLHGTKLLLDMCYRIGFNTKSKNKKTDKDDRVVYEKFRQPFRWNDQDNLTLSRRAVYWVVDPNTCICVELNSAMRLMLEDTSALIFRLLADGNERNQVIEIVCAEYDISDEEATSDVDEFVQHLLDENILVKSTNNSAGAASSSESLKELRQV